MELRLGSALDPSKCSKMSMEEKRNLVYEISDQPQASELLQSWSRHEILEILCAEMGKERKYTGLTKLKIIENLLKIVSEKKSGSTEDVTDLDSQSSPCLSPKITKRQRKIDQPSRLPVSANNIPISNSRSDSTIAVYCRNSACKAILNQNDKFCKRCSCCICYQYDDNKDPSLWLSCSSDPPFQGTSCGMSCHLECALKHEKSGISKGQQAGMEGTFYCVSCRKANDLLGCWRKQLMKAKETRRVDILCYRISLSKKLLSDGEKYQDVYQIVDEAVRKLEAEVGPLTGVPVGTGRGIVNRLSSGPEVQKLCTLAIDTLDSLLSNKMILHELPSSMIQDTNLVATNFVRFEDVEATYLTVVVGTEDVSSGKTAGYRLWHRKACEIDYPTEPTCTLSQPNLSFVVRGLTPSSEYYFKAISFDGTGDLGMCEVQVSTASAQEDGSSCLVIERSQSPVTNFSELSNPSSVEDETNNVMPCSDQTDSRTENSLSYCKDTNKITTVNLSKDAINCTDISGGGTAKDSVSLLDEEHVTKKTGMLPDPIVSKLEDRHSSEVHIIEDTSMNNGSNSAIQEGTKCTPFVSSSEAGLPVTPCKMEILKDVLGRSGRLKSSTKDRENGSGGEELRHGSTSKKRSAERQDADCTANGISDKDFEYYVKLIRWLECEGHIEKNFRQKFLTWYSLRATTQEVRIVKAFVDNFIEDPSALAEQLVDTFSECISSKKTCAVPAGFCMKLWH